MPSGPSYESGPGGLPRGASIGRYVVLGLVGRGGMGEVYAAYDHELDRKVAVKLLRVKPGNGVSLAEGRQRTLREAQAIARLSHSNVVIVYDVGTFEDQVFIAMEFVDGNTVTYWIQSQARTWQEVLRVFSAAGRGLQAAHDKELVHRDFKPDNVMVGRDGTVRVMDFGLARQVGERSERPPSRSADDAAAMLGDDEALATIVINQEAAQSSDTQDPLNQSGLFDTQLTRTGAMMGTPAYMSPEQFLGTVTDARTDQFSFCIALYEALYGERPFGGNSMFALTANVVQGNVKEAPAGTKVPPWVRRILLRGLRPNAEERFPSMRALLEALDKDPAVARRRRALTIAAALVPLAVALGVRQSVASHHAVCGSGTERLAGVWELRDATGAESPRQAAVHHAFLATKKTYAADVYASVERILGNYAKSWAGMYHEACEATQVRGEQSADVLDLRMSCLQERLDGLRALTQVFSDATGEVVENAVGASTALGTLNRCADVPLLRAVVRPPEDPATRARVDDLRRQLADRKARYDAGRWRDGADTADRLLAEVRAVGYQPLVAETLAFFGAQRMSLDDPARGATELEESFRQADASRHDDVRVIAASTLVWDYGYLQGKYADAHAWARTAEAVLARIGGHEVERAWLLNNLAAVEGAEGHSEEALHAHLEALALKEKVRGPGSADVGISEGNLAIVLEDLGRNQEALEHVDRSIDVLSRGLGAEHPDVATQLSNRGEILNALGRYRDARLSFERARIIWERELGLDARILAYALTGIGVSYLGERDAMSAVAPLERAWKIREAKETDPGRRGETLFALARALWDADRDRHRAQALGQTARAAYAKVGQPSMSTKVGDVDTWLAQRQKG
ncbi:MAG TPA: serine/threonine-protein kinase [Polyangia bacterium]|nr:serine/threonine-protein kinase [Polyangia bacterium]